MAWGPDCRGERVHLLHEATHQWCFHSPIGNVLLGLTARAEVIATLLMIVRDKPEMLDQSAADQPEATQYGPQPQRRSQELLALTHLCNGDT